MAGPRLLRAGGTLFLAASASGRSTLFEIGRSPVEAAAIVENRFVGWTNDRLLAELRDAPETEVVEPALAEWLRREGVRGQLLGAPEWRAVTHEAPDLPLLRAFLLERARLALGRAIAEPEAQLVALAREEERTERAVDREAGAADAWITGGAVDLGEHADVWKEFRSRFAEHHGQLRARVERLARRVVPNLADVVGPRTAARLIARAGGVAPLARMTAGRIQLLGARRRPRPGGPRYGILYSALATFEPPAESAGAFARSLAALAAIAARADATTHRAIGPGLARRRDRRLEYLRRRRR
ncbi:MAG TPA: hypothetical protein VFF67_10465 [Thermoplasmata archaeon]|nr:hypothetical protein [Thermoplasmata archaeon]